MIKKKLNDLYHYCLKALLTFGRNRSAFSSRPKELTESEHIQELTSTDPSDVITKIGEDLYLSEEMADFHFEFEIDDGEFERVPAHKVFLITASDVFRAMFNGTWEENKEVEIVDASVDEFKEFLQFFYLQKVKVSMRNVARVMYLGNKYNIAKCMSVCEKFIINTVNENNVCWAYELAVLYDQTNLKKYCETFIGINTSAVLKSENILNCDSKMLGHILKFDSLSCPETELFEACMSWVRAIAGVDQLTRKLVQAQLGEIFYAFRFKSMTPQQFDTILLTYSQLFSVDECMEISQMFGSQQFEPSIFNEKLRTSFENRHYNEKDILHCERHLSNFRSAAWLYYIQRIEKTRFSINKPLLLTHFLCSRVYQCMSDAYCEIDELPTEITVVQLSDAIDFEEENVLHSEENTLQSDRCTFVTLPKVILIKPGKIYEIRMKQSPPERCCIGLMLKTEVKMDSNIIVQFHGNEVLDKDKVTKGTIISLQFKRIY